MVTRPQTPSNKFIRHPELVSGSIGPVARKRRAQICGAASLPSRTSGEAAKWILKQVQDDENGWLIPSWQRILP
jgi:hypothetical protein